MKETLGAGPTVLFLDNFEDNQEEESDGRLKNPALGEALFDLAQLGGPDFRMLFTSRSRVHLGPGPFKVRSLDLGGLSPSGCRKLRSLPRFAELGKLPEEAWQRALFHFGGHPKALELLEGFLREQPDRLLQGRLLMQAGQPREALKKFEAAREGFEKGEHLKERAVTLGDVARLRAQAGDAAGALKLHEEMLAISRQLGDIEAIAGAQYALAGLDWNQGNRSQALERLAESWDIFRRIGRVDAIAFVGEFYGFLFAESDPVCALKVLRTSREAFQLLGMDAEVNEVTALIQKLEEPEQPAP